MIITSARLHAIKYILHKNLAIHCQCNAIHTIGSQLTAKFIVLMISFIFTNLFVDLTAPHLQGKDTMAFAPFGQGPRRCPGYHFSYVEVNVFLTIILQQFTIKPVGKLRM